MNKMKIGFDMFSTVKILDKTAVYTGGANYAKGILKLLKKERDIQNVCLEILVPNGFIPDESERELFYGDNCSLTSVNNLKKIDCNNMDILFLPQVNGSVLAEIPYISKKNPEMKIYATLHDRQHNISKYDKYDKYYCKDGIISGITDCTQFYIKRAAFNFLYGRNIRYVDKLFTVSNYSAQQLIHKNVKDIYIFHQLDITCDYTSVESPYKDYILLVGGNRPEKNLVRTLEAYCEYKKKFPTGFMLIVTGIDQELIDKMDKVATVDKKIIESDVKFLNYVNYEELSGLYDGCSYTVFMSKGEGYGLPVLESIRHGKTVLASRLSSIPEVAGAAVKYVDPYNIESICEGFIYFSDKENLKRYTEYAKERSIYMARIAEQDSKIMLQEILKGVL